MIDRRFSNSPVARLVAMGSLLSLGFSLAGCQESALPASQSSQGGSTSAAVEKAKPGESTPADSAAAKPSASAAAGPVRDITFDKIKFDMKKENPFLRSMLTPAIEKLDGSRIRIRGFIFPPPQKAGLRRFVLVRDNMSCCFGPGAALYDSIVVDMPPGETTEYNVSPISVEGTFNVKVVSMTEGKTISIYHLAAERVK